MTRHTLEAVRRWRAGGEMEVWYAGGDECAMRGTFEEGLTYVAQGEGSLGDRLHRAFRAAADAECRASVAIGTDCPGVDQAVLDEAFAALQRHEAVIGPATDGGYCLIGLRRPSPELFASVDWGTDRVLNQIKAIAERLELDVAWLDERPDVDEPGDLAVWEALAGVRERADEPIPRLSIVIPTINEAEHLPETLDTIGEGVGVQVVVADGGSTDRTRAIAEAHGCLVVRSAPGRAVQMNAGAQAAGGELLLFLHADTRLPAGYLQQVETLLGAEDVAAGAFQLALDNRRWSLRLVEAGANLRSVARQLPYGDQALFLARRTFDELGGFRELPVMEDYELVRRLRQRGRIAIAPSAVVSSARRWLERGVWRTTLTHQRMIVGWHLGVRPERLVRIRSADA